MSEEKNNSFMGLPGSLQGHTPSDLETYYKATVIKAGQHCTRDGHTPMEQKTESRSSPIQMWSIDF